MQMLLLDHHFLPKWEEEECVEKPHNTTQQPMMNQKKSSKMPQLQAFIL